MKIISGNSNIELSKEISEYLKIQLSETTMTRFSDKEIFVEIGENVIIHSQVNISGNTKIGNGNKIYPFSAIGNDPQDLKFDGEETKLVIGNNNKIREYVTIHPGTSGGGGSAESTLTLLPATNYSITIGAGGAGGATTGTGLKGDNGSNSIFSSITSIGGGHGGGHPASGSGDPNANGGNGGSGGGGGKYSAQSTPGSGTTNQGYDGGTAGNNAGGGGGGASAAGTNGGGNAPGGNGGNGVASSITGSAVTRGGGGGGGCEVPSSASDAGSGGTGGGGTGGAAGSVGSAPTAGTPNTGGGGGGSGDFNSGGNYPGQSGGSGIVIVRYSNSFSLTNPGGGLGFSQQDTPISGTSDLYTEITSGTGNIQFN